MAPTLRSTTEYRLRGSGRVAGQASLQRAGDGGIPAAARLVNGPGSIGSERLRPTSRRRRGTVIRASAIAHAGCGGRESRASNSGNKGGTARTPRPLGWRGFLLRITGADDDASARLSP